MDRFTMYPVAFVTTVQPYLLTWVIAISFFLCLAVVALMSKGKDWKQVLLMFGGGYVVTAVIVTLVSSMLLDIAIMQVEVVSVEPRSSFD